MNIEFKCENCGQPMSIGEEHTGKEANCPKCGLKLTIPTVEQIQKQPDEKFCSSCGKKIDEDEKFCPSCGSSITAAPRENKKWGQGIVSERRRGMRYIIGGIICTFLAFPALGLLLIPGIGLFIVAAQLLKDGREMLSTYRGACPYCEGDVNKIKKPAHTCPYCKKTFAVKEDGLYQMD